MTTTLLPVGTICVTVGGVTDADRLVVVLRAVGAFPHANVTEGYWVGTMDRLPFVSISVYKAADGTFNTKPNLSNACIVDRKHLRVVDLSAQRSGMSTLKFPYLIVRIYSGVYQREEISVQEGPRALAQIAHAGCILIHPEPFDAEGAISSVCRRFMVRAVQDAQRPAKFRTCLVWAPSDCTYIEADSSIDSSEPPSGEIDFDLPANPRLVISLSAGSPSVTH